MEFSNSSAGALFVMTMTIAAVHALIPSHWLAFALVGRAQRWPTKRTLIIAALAGSGHIATTVALGLVLATAGKAFHNVIPEGWDHMVASVLLCALGAVFVLRSRRGKHVCSHPHDHASEEILEERIGNNMTAVGALVLGLTLSPCLELLPVYLAASQLSWMMLAAISLTMALTTLGIMLLLIWLTLQGMKRMRLHWLEKNEGLLIGSILILLGLALLII